MKPGDSRALNLSAPSALSRFGLGQHRQDCACLCSGLASILIQAALALVREGWFAIESKTKDAAGHYFGLLF
jgi:hypothetical protein